MGFNSFKSLFPVLVVLTFCTFPALADNQTNLLTNGSFEFWTQHHPNHKPDPKQFPNVDAKDPLVPTRWAVRGYSDTTMTKSANAHGGKHALSVSIPKGKAGVTMRLDFLEVNPGSTYTYGVFVKGTGKVSAAVSGVAVEGQQTLESASALAGDEWQHIGGQFTAPRHIRLVSLILSINGPGELTIDDAHISAELDSPYSADAILTDKPARDAQTILLADFEEKDPSFVFDCNAHLTKEGGGRFGKGLRLDSPDSVRMPLTLEKMPDEGTIECWLSPDEWEKKQSYFLFFESPRQDLASLASDSSSSLRWSWRIDNERYGKKHSAAMNSDLSLKRFKAGQWMHVAITWDKSAVRYYVDGVLVKLHTEWPLTLWGTPNSIIIGGRHGHLRWNGCIDEIRFSSARRYATPLPKGATASNLPVVRAPEATDPVEAAAPAVTAPGESAKTDVANLTDQRKKLLGQVDLTSTGQFETKPNAKGEFIYEAPAAQPLVTGALCEHKKDFGIAGLMAVKTGGYRCFRSPTNDGVYWKIKDIPAGKYYIQLMYQSDVIRSKEIIEAPASGGDIHLNGRIVQCTTLSEPVQIKPGMYLATLQAADAESLKPGDEITFVSTNHAYIVRLVLSKNEPYRSPFKRGMNFGTRYGGNYPNLQLNVDTYFVDAKGQPLSGGLSTRTDKVESLLHVNGKPVGHCRIANPLPVELKVEFECVIKDHYLRKVGSEKQTLTLAPHEAVVREIPFNTFLDASAYSMTAKVKATNSKEARELLGWPETNTVSLLEGFRQSVPWMDPFDKKLHCRVEFLSPVQDVRQTYRLDGVWEMALTTSLQPPMPAPADMTFKPRRVPFRYHEASLKTTPRSHGAYVRRTFTVPKELIGRSCRLAIKSITDEGTAYVNNIKVGNVRGGSTPLIADVTKALREGQNEIVVVIRDMLSIMNPAYVNPKSPEGSQSYLDAPGLFGRDAVGLDEVALEFSPALAAEDVFAITSYRKKELATRFKLVNHFDKARKVIVEPVVMDGTEVVLKLGKKELTLAAGAGQEVAISSAWDNPRLWSPVDPHMYVLAIHTSDAETGEVLDLARERFGFRECWIEGPHIMFNGLPVKLKGATAHSAFWVDGDYYLNRNDANQADFLDEIGYLVTQCVTSVSNSSSTHNVDRDIFWDTAKTNMIAAIKLRQNHPCIIAWDLSNEWYCFLGYSNGDNMVGARRLYGLTEVARDYDTSRWTFYNGDGDLSGLLDNFCGHYILEGSRPNPITGFGFNGHSNYFPDGAFWRALDADFTEGQDICVNSYKKWFIKYNKQPIMNTENLWKVGGYMPPGMTKVVGEDDVVSPAIDSGRGEIVWFWKQNLDAHRDMGCNSVSSYQLTGIHSRAYVNQCFIMPDTLHHGFASRQYKQRYSLHNDVFWPARMVLSWRLTAPDGKTVASGQDAKEMKTADLQRGELSFALPSVQARTNFVLDVRLEADGKFVYGEQRDLEVWPDQPKLTLPQSPLRTVYLWDPKGTTAAVFAAAGIAHKPVGEMKAPEGIAGESMLVIGEDCIDQNSADFGGLQNFVAKGGRVLVFAQKVGPLNLPVETKLEARELSSMPFIRTSAHPVFAGNVSSWDLQFWCPRRVSAIGAYTKPEGGSSVVLVDSGTITGMEWVQMMEIFAYESHSDAKGAPANAGSYLLCQLNLISGFKDEPMAREILAKTIGYAASPATVANPSGQLKVITQADSLIERQLREVGVVNDAVGLDYKVNSKSILLLDVSTTDISTLKAQDSPTAAAWAKAVNDGATIVVSCVQPEDAEWLSKLTGTDVTITVNPYRMWTGRGYRMMQHPLTMGLSQADLYFKEFKDRESDGAQAEEPSLAIEPFQDFSVKASGAQELVFPGAMIEVKVGQGRVIIDQRRWMTSNPKLQVAAYRNLSSLAIGLGVGITPVAKPRELPKNITYRPINISTLANRALADDMAEDGIGGWSDQGPTADLRTFKTGKQSIGGVPFDVAPEPNTIIVLAGARRPGKLPDEVTIPVGFKSEGFYFVHGAAYSRAKLVALYQVQYADGSTHDVELRNSENIRDWATKPTPFLREKSNTRTTVAWSGSTPMWPLVGVYRMLWVNPRPEVPVRAIRFANPAKGSVPMLIALTAVIGKDAKVEIPKDTAEAAKLLAEAKMLTQPADQKKAYEMLNKAISMDPHLADAYQTLSARQEQADDLDGALKTYKQWIDAGAITPLPFNRIGEILQKRGDLKGAVEAYKQSLRIEFNQPEITEAKKRLEDKLAE